MYTTLRRFHVNRFHETNCSDCNIVVVIYFDLLDPPTKCTPDKPTCESKMEDVSKDSAAVLEFTLATDVTAGVKKKSKKLDCRIGRTIRVKQGTTFFS